MATVLSAWVPARQRLPNSLARPWESSLGCLLVLSLWCLALFFYGLDAGELVRTEGLRAMVARAMLHSGNWIVPTLYGEPLFTKPPLHYLAIVLCSWPFGDVTPCSARLPSAIAATVMVWMFFAFFRRHLGARAGLLAGLMLPMSALWLDKVPSAEIDMVHVAWVAVSILCLLRAVEADDNARLERRWWYLATLAMACGFLTKWTAPAFFYVTAVALLWQRGRLGLLLNRHHLLGLGLATSLCLGWMICAASLTSWRVFSETVLREGLPRLLPNYDRPYRYGEALLHPGKILLTTLPWSFFALWTLWPGFYRGLDERSKFLAAAFHSWTWPNVLVWSYVGEHTPRHSFPLFPGIAGLAVLGFLGGFGRLQAFKRITLIGLLAVWLLMKILFVEVVLPARAEESRARERGQALAQLLPAEGPLYVLDPLDETMLFYCGRPIIRLYSTAELPLGPVRCLVSQAEWRRWQTADWHIHGRLGSMLLIGRVLPRFAETPF